MMQYFRAYNTKLTRIYDTASGSGEQDRTAVRWLTDMNSAFYPSDSYQDEIALFLMMSQTNSRPFCDLSYFSLFIASVLFSKISV
jgi:hypothetical protein